MVCLSLSFYRISVPWIFFQDSVLIQIGWWRASYYNVDVDWDVLPSVFSALHFENIHPYIT